MGIDIESRKGMVIYLVPNILTSCSIFLGFYAIIRSIMGDYETAAYAIIFASVFDALDGRVARMTGSTSAFGEQYDSLADAISFGVAPALLMFKWSLSAFGRVGWLACFVYMTCGVLRLARFNVQKSSVEKNFFQGLPIPVAAGTIVSSVLFFQELGLVATKNYYMLVMMFVLAALMVSNFRFKNFKNMDKDRKKTFLTLVGVVLIIVVIAHNPKVMLLFFLLAYIILGLLANLLKWKRYKEAIDELKELEEADEKLKEDS